MVVLVVLVVVSLGVCLNTLLSEYLYQIAEGRVNSIYALVKSSFELIKTINSGWIYPR